MNNSTEKEIVEIYVDDIIPNRFQPRLIFDENGIKELSTSIKEHGIIQPLVVRKLGDKYEIIAGERRYKASMMAGLKKVPVIVMDLSDKESAEVAVVENLQRRDLTPLEEAKSYKKLLDKRYLTQEQLATRMGKNQATISNKLRLLNLDPSVQEALLKEQISERHARSLLSLKDFGEQQKVLSEIITKKLTVKQTDDLIKGMISTMTIEDPLKDLFIDEPMITPQPKTIPNMAAPVIEIKEPETPVTQVVTNTFDFPTAPIQPTVYQDLDINKIKEEAQDINVPKPLADINTILESPIEEQKIEAIQPMVEEKSKNRFLPDLEDEETNMDLFEEMDIPEQVVEKPVVEPVSIPNVEQTPIQEPTFSQIESKPMVEQVVTLPVQEQPKMDEVTTLPTQTYSIPAIYEDEDEVEPVMPIQSTNPSFGIRDAINAFREVSKKVEMNGFVLDLDEYDMENEYQITIHINKNRK